MNVNEAPTCDQKEMKTKNKEKIRWGSKPSGRGSEVGLSFGFDHCRKLDHLHRPLGQKEDLRRCRPSFDP